MYCLWFKLMGLKVLGLRGSLDSQLLLSSSTLSPQAKKSSKQNWDYEIVLLCH